MKGIKEAFIDAGEISQMLGIGMTKAYAIIKEYNAELEAKGYFTIKNNGGITFLTTDNKNGVLAGIDKDGVCGRRIHTKLKIKIIVHGVLLPKDT